MNKTVWKGLAAGAMAACLLATLSACGKGLTEKDAETYVKGHLDAAYLGVYEIDDKEMHEDNVSGEAEYYLLDFLEIYYPTDEIIEQAADVMEQIYAKSKYTVGTGSKTKDGDFVVEVTVSPLSLYDLLTDDDYFDALEEAGYDDAETEEEYAAVDAIYGPLILDLLEDRLDDITYGKDQIIMVQMKLDDEGYYAPVETGLQKIDEVMIDYYGAYAD